MTSKERTPSHWLGEILAVIHGDGGYYRAKHGDAKATEDAIAKYYATRADALCPHGLPLAENVCGPCSHGRPNRPAPETSVPIPAGFALYKRVGSILARPWTQQDVADYLNGIHTNVSVSEADKHTACVAQGMLAMNPDNSYDCWYIAPAYFAKHYADSPLKTGEKYGG